MKETENFRSRVIEKHDYKSLMGPCLISFSIPLLVPGVTLTLVGIYSDSDVFPLFGGWHITGIVFLSVAVLLLITGIVLRCIFKPIITPDIEEHLSPAPSLLGKTNFAFEHEKGLETMNGIYKDRGKQEGRLESTLKSHKLVSTKTNKSLSQTPEASLGNTISQNGIRHSSRKDRHDIIVSKGHEPPDGRQRRNSASSRDRKVTSDRDSDIERTFNRKRSRVKSQRSRSSDIGSDSPLNPDTSDRDTMKHRKASRDGDSSESGPPPYDQISAKTRKKKRSVSKAPSFGLDKQAVTQGSSTTEGPWGGVKTTVRTSVTSDPSTLVKVASGDMATGQQQGQEPVDSVRHTQRRKRKRKKRRRSQQREGNSSNHGDNSGNDSSMSGASVHILPELRVKPNIPHVDHRDDPHHVEFKLRTDEIEAADPDTVGSWLQGSSSKTQLCHLYSSESEA